MRENTEIQQLNTVCNPESNNGLEKAHAKNCLNLNLVTG